MPPGATGNADSFALAGKHESPDVAGVSGVGRLVAPWSTENKKTPDPLDVASYRAATVWDSRAARLFRRLLEIVRSIMAPQLMHFQA